MLAGSEFPLDCRDRADELEDLDSSERRDRFFFVAVRVGGCGSSSPPCWGCSFWGLAPPPPLLNRLRRENILLLRRLDLLPDPIVAKRVYGLN